MLFIVISLLSTWPSHCATCDVSEVQLQTHSASRHSPALDYHRNNSPLHDHPPNQHSALIDTQHAHTTYGALKHSSLPTIHPSSPPARPLDIITHSHHVDTRTNNHIYPATSSRPHAATLTHSASSLLGSGLSVAPSASTASVTGCLCVVVQPGHYLPPLELAVVQCIDRCLRRLWCGELQCAEALTPTSEAIGRHVCAIDLAIL